MNLADMLCYADIHQLKRIAQKYDCDCSVHSKHELIQSILVKVQRKETVRRMISDLQQEDLRFLSSFLFDARDAFSPEELIARAQHSRFAEDEGVKDERGSERRLISEYRARGWLFNGITKHNRYLLQFPRDLKKKFGELLLERLSRSLEYVEEPHVYRDERQLLAQDMLHFLRFVSREEVPLTTAGFMYKRQLQMLLSSLAVGESLPAKAAWRFGYGRRFREYPERFSFLYDYVWFHGWIKEREDRLILNAPGESVLAENKVPGTNDLYKFWLRLYKGPIHNIQTIVHWVEGLAKQWVTVQSLTKTLLPFVKPFYYDRAEDVLQKRILLMMMHIGLLSFGECEQNGAVVRMHESGRQIMKGIFVEDKEKIDIPVP